MTEQRTVVLGGPASTGRTPQDLRTTETARDGYRRLSVVTGVIAGAALVGFLVWLVEALVADEPGSPWSLAAFTALLTFSAGVVVGCRRAIFPPKAYVAIALATEIIVSLTLGASIMGWQYRLGEDGVAWLVEGAAQPLALGAGEVPWAGIWIILFATLIPLRPGLHLFGAVLSVATLPLWTAASAVALGFPAALQNAGATPTLHLAVWLLYRGALAAGIAYFAARRVHGLRRRLAEARRMGSYQLQEKLGEGGMGEVWKADHQMLARSAAIKLIKAGEEGSGTPWHEMTQRFEREVQAAAQLRSPHTIEIYDYGLTEDGTFYYVMELLDGLDLQKLVKTHGPLPWRRAVHVLQQTCHSLAEAHERGLVHRDIKPANIFLCRVGRDVDQIKVLDFGLVKASTSSDGDSGLTQKGVFLGTPAYAAPELAQGDVDRADARSDLYSLGCVAFWLLSGRMVFEAGTPLDMLIKHARDEPDPPSRFSELKIPSQLDRIVLQCLAKDATERPSTADELSAQLGELEQQGTWTDSEAGAWWQQHRPQAGGGTISS